MLEGIMQIRVGSKNPAKIKAVAQVFPEAEVIGMDVPSHVAAQPFSDHETKLGAVNRAKQCSNVNPPFIGIGLEGGVMRMDDEMYLCNWGALVTPDSRIYTASGAKIPLPKEIKSQLDVGEELGYIMDAYVQKKDVRKQEGAIGIFTNGHITRSDMFEHVVKILRGQWEYMK